MPIIPVQTKSGIKHKVNFSLGGRRIIKTFSDKATAKLYEAKTRAEYLDAINSQTLGRSPNKTYKQALLRWMKSSAPESMKDHIKATLVPMGDVLLKDCVQKAVEMKEQFIHEGKAYATINRRLAVVKRVLNLAYKEYGWLDAPIATKIQLLSENNERRVYRTAEQIITIAKFCVGADERKAILIAAFMGLRRAEIINIETNVVSNNVLYVLETKTGHPRSVPIPNFLVPAFETLPLKITKRSLRTNFNNAKKLAGDPDLRFHDLRHVYAGLLARSTKISITQIRDLLGHTSLKTTNRYIYLMQEHENVLSILDNDVPNLYQK